MTSTLNRFDTYAYHMGQELTGSYILADKPVSVISGALCTRSLPDTSKCDPVVSYVPPVATLGTMYIVPAIAGRAPTTGYYARVGV